MTSFEILTLAIAVLAIVVPILAAVGVYHCKKINEICNNITENDTRLCVIEEDVGWSKQHLKNGKS